MCIKPKKPIKQILNLFFFKIGFKILKEPNKYYLLNLDNF